MKRRSRGIVVKLVVEPYVFVGRGVGGWRCDGGLEGVHVVDLLVLDEDLVAQLVGRRKLCAFPPIRIEQEVAHQTFTQHFLFASQQAHD